MNLMNSLLNNSVILLLSMCLSWTLHSNMCRCVHRQPQLSKQQKQGCDAKIWVTPSNAL